MPYADFIDLTKESERIEGPTYWKKALGLYWSDKECLLKGKWLNDGIIRAVQSLMKKAYPSVRGLQSPILGLNLNFEIQRGEFVQVLHVYGSHWLTISNIGCKPGEIFVYDSLPNCELYSCSKRQIASILHSDKKKIDVIFMDVQIQCGASDCGAFALAFAMSLCAGDNPAELYYVQHSMRDHLLACIEKEEITPFPVRERRKLCRVRERTSFKIYCSCRQPQYGDMISCSVCREWYHKECEKAPNEAWTKNSLLWKCSYCKL